MMEEEEEQSRSRRREERIGERDRYIHSTVV